MAKSLPTLTNHGEDKNFFLTALAWQGSASPRVLPRVAIFVGYALAVVGLLKIYPHLSFPMTPFEYGGVVLGLMLVLRVNAGLDRWWEARKIWGSIVNQSRNLAIISYEYSDARGALRNVMLRWIAAWPHVMRDSLRRENELREPSRLLGSYWTSKIREASHMPTFVGSRIAKLLGELRRQGLDDFAFQRAERERALLIDAIGACERIRNTPMPLTLAINTRRFIFFFLLLLPLALVDKAGLWTPLIVALAAYPLLALDEIGAELQNPFSPRNLSHLPLDTICSTIEGNVLQLEDDSFAREDVANRFGQSAATAEGKR